MGCLTKLVNFRATSPARSVLLDARPPQVSITPRPEHRHGLRNEHVARPPHVIQPHFHASSVLVSMALTGAQNCLLFLSLPLNPSLENSASRPPAVPCTRASLSSTLSPTFLPVRFPPSEAQRGTHSPLKAQSVSTCSSATFLALANSFPPSNPTAALPRLCCSSSRPPNSCQFRSD